MLVHSIEEFEPEPDYTLLTLVNAEDDTAGIPSTATRDQTFDVEVLNPFGPQESDPLGSPFAVTSEIISGSGETLDVVLTGSGLADATMRVSAEARHIVDATSFVVAPDTLAHVGRLRFHAVDVTFFPDLDEEPLDLDVWLPIARIHRPSRAGCKSTYMVTNENIATYDAQFSVGPVFGKATAKFKVLLGKTYGASATCKEARIRAKLMIIPGTIVVGGQSVASGTINRIHSVSKDWHYVDLSPKFDWCGWDENKIRDPNPTIKDLSGATGGIDDAEVDQLIIAREISGTLGVGVEMRQLPASVSVAFTRTCAESVALTTTLMPGAKYIGYLPRPGNPLEKCWTVAKS